MLERYSNDEEIYINISFTELFHILKQSSCLNANTTGYTSKEINILLMHAENAITGLLHGLQAMGALIATSTLVDKNDVVHLGHFLSLIANLIEALHILRADCELQLYEKELVIAI